MAVVVSLAALFLTQHLNDRHEASLLRSDTTQAAALTSSELANTVSLLDSLATTVTTTNGSPAAFLAAAHSLVHGSLSAGLAKEYLTHYVFFAATGPALKTGQELSDAVIVATHNAGISPSPSPVVRLEGDGAAILAVGAPFVPDRNIVYLQLRLTPLIAASTTAGSAFHDIRVSLYGSPHPAVATPGAWASAPVQVSGVTWTLVAQARSPLIGGFAAVAPLIILVLGLALSLALGVAVELLTRRRAPRLSATDRDAKVATTAGPAPPSATSSPASADALSDVESRSGATTDEPVVTEAGASAVAPGGDAGAQTPGDVEGRPTEDEGVGSPPSGPESSPHADWRPDPFGRFEFRRFFLQKPTSVVRSGATEGYDPVAPLLEQASAVSEPAPPGPSDEPLSVSDDAPQKADGGADAEVGREGAEASPVEVVADTRETLENMAARLAEAVAQEINELQNIASEIGEFSVSHLTEQVDPPVAAPPPPLSTPPTPPPPTLPAPPPPPGTPPPPAPQGAPTLPMGEARAGPVLATNPLTPSPEAAENGPSPEQKREPAKTVAVASGALGLASFLWRRHRKRRDHT